MMGRTCRHSHCAQPAASRYSPYCRRHKSILRRHGHPEQSAVTKTELMPVRRRVEARIAKNASSPLWDQLGGLWGQIVEDARSEASKATGNRYQRSAAIEVLNISADVATREIMVTTCAMFVLRAEHPTRFYSDAAFWLQLARRVRALSERHSGRRYDHRTGLEKRVYREMTPKAGTILGRKLAAVFGAAGLQMAALDQRDIEKADKARQTIRTAIAELK